jgi:hypothetical protein
LQQPCIRLSLPRDLTEGGARARVCMETPTLFPPFASVQRSGMGEDQPVPAF